jgi:asparagine synthase (glutamine-hydrolysing)
MCGLAGFARTDGGALSEGSLPILEAMARSLSHRGPDDTKLLLDDPVGLAFNRLSIVDPVGGDQPLWSDDGSVVLIANGEIYNHRELARGLPAGTRFKTQSDCEVLIHLYRRDGVRFLDDVRGIYAVIIWDRARGRLVFARDRFGIKPLYFSRNGDRITFASEIKAIFAHPAAPRRLDWEACLVDQMATGASHFEDRRPVSWFEGIETVPAASVLEIELRTGELREHRYWTLPRPGEGVTLSPQELVRGYGELLAASVEESCMSDAEIGLFLSGGIDSAAVAAFSGSRETLHTFTALNGGTFANGDGEYAHRVAAALGRPNHQIVFDAERVPTRDEWKRLLWLLETPLCGPEAFYKYELHRFARATRPELKVMLLGQAADEFNGGYTVLEANGGDWNDFVANLRTLARRRGLLDCPRLTPWWDRELPLVLDEALHACGARLPDDPYPPYVAHLYRQIQQYNNWHEDRTAAGNGVEARVPFLDQRIVELTAAIPIAERKRLLWDKQILREALRGVFPGELLDRPKVPFFHGSGIRHVHRTFVRMLAEGGDALVDEAFAGPRAREVVDIDGVRAALRRLEQRPGPDVELLLRLVNAGLLEQMVAEVPEPPISWPAQPLPRELHVTSWDAERDAIEDELLPRGPLPLDAVPDFADDVLLVRAEPPERATWFLVVDGSLEYVIDEAEDAEWLGFLRAVDGERELGEILARLGDGLDALEPVLREAIEVGVLVLRPGEPERERPVAAAPPVGR